ncbi:BZIP transcription factor [Phytophthora palmivora]|uniref:BZIP transcription factor n=1 Tax=Phytophthora palmivora TaxID=4796 RepID=A0A2P4WXD1_9STRA|nr:BZIP transcription factor [Phytophthora palmivora]
MAPDVTDGIVCGVEALLEHWKLVSQYFSDVNVELKRLEEVAPDSLLATTVVSVTITDNTLCQVFPHLVGEGGRVSPLGEKLRNQRVVLRGSVRFDWDASMGRVLRHESKVDGLTPVLQLLGGLEDVATVFDKALVTLEGKFVGAKIVVAS